MSTVSGEREGAKRVSGLFVCPHCRAHEFDVVSDGDGETVNFVCVDCQRRSYLELGYVSLLDDPVTFRPSDLS